MGDVVTPEVRSRMMSGIRSRDTRPEHLVRSGLFAAGFRYRLHRRDLPGTPDLVLAKWNAAIFINGCFWHAHHGCRYFRVPKNREPFWTQKLEANRTRDAINTAALVRGGWKVITVWECALRADVAATLNHLQGVITDGSATRQWEIREPACERDAVEVLKPN